MTGISLLDKPVVTALGFGLTRSRGLSTELDVTGTEAAEVTGTNGTVLAADPFGSDWFFSAGFGSDLATATVDDTVAGFGSVFTVDDPLGVVCLANTDEVPD